jgi:glyoxylase-like metal-dependent hydrolase (beta-lactamase superfamily II)
MSLPPTALGLWPEMLFVERGWLSANLTLFVEPEGATVVDTGYCTHAPQTLTLLTSALQGRPLTRILNTHLHSDHCGGNAALQAHWPQVRTWIAPGPASHVHHWDTQALSYTPTGQTCPRFRADALLQPGTRMVLGTREWEVHAAPGHDPDSVVLFEPERRLLISADALWEQGFGVVFPEIEGVQAFDAVAATLELIESLQPAWVLPGHGTMFSDVDRALRTARERLQHFVASPPSHARYAAKVATTPAHRSAALVRTHPVSAHAACPVFRGADAGRLERRLGAVTGAQRRRRAHHAGRRDPARQPLKLTRSLTHVRTLPHRAQVCKFQGKSVLSGWLDTLGPMVPKRALRDCDWPVIKAA